MKKTDFEKLITSIKQAGEIKCGKKQASRKFVDVSEIRHKMGLSQMQFANLIHISERTLQNWEQKRRVPHGPALSLLTIIKNKPVEAVEALNKGI
jgi:putative transcriptional regulator